jgi:hypothetical protein
LVATVPWGGVGLALDEVAAEVDIPDWAHAESAVIAEPWVETEAEGVGVADEIVDEIAGDPVVFDEVAAPAGDGVAP